MPPLVPTDNIIEEIGTCCAALRRLERTVQHLDMHLAIGAPPRLRFPQ
jgi:hypothetical protein